MKIFYVVFSISFFTALCAEAQRQEVGHSTLDQYYSTLKTKSGTYQVYKVINERELEDFWRTVQDSIRNLKVQQRRVVEQMTALKAELKESQNQLKEKNASMEGVVFDSHHINVLGVSFAKTTFITLFVILTLTLIIGAVAVLWMWRYSRARWHDRVAHAEFIQKEFDDFRRKALDKEAKILRQLQDERNRHNS
jgi:hypothetical protein